MFLYVFAISVGFGISVCETSVHNTTAADTNIESTIGIPTILVDPTLMSTTRNTTVEQYEVSGFPFSLLLRKNNFLYEFTLLLKKYFCVVRPF